MFVEVIRQYVEALPQAERGWLAGLRDKSVGRALNLMHGRPAHGWTLEEMAGEIGLSAFSRAFKRSPGMAPAMCRKARRNGKPCRQLAQYLVVRSAMDPARGTLWGMLH